MPSVVENDSDSSADAVLLASLYSLIDGGVGTLQESVILFSTNVPESEVAQCMSAAGFQYIEDQSQDPEVMASSGPQSWMSAEDYARRFGLGITAWDLGLFPASPADPNAAYYASLSDGQRDAYNQSHGQCAGRFDAARRARSDALNVALEPFRSSVVADERVVAALAAWRTCMATSGFDYESPNAMRQTFYTRMPAGTSHADLEDLHAEEVLVAVANVPCEAAYTAEYRTVVGERFAEFKSLFESALATGAAPDAQG